MRKPGTNYTRFYMLLDDILIVLRIETIILVHRYLSCTSRRQHRVIVEHARRYSVIKKLPAQVKHLDRLVNVTDYDYVANPRMDRNTFGRLCLILSERSGLWTGKCVGVEEQVAMFISVLAHHHKNCVVKFHFWRSGSTVSNYVNKVLGAVLSLHAILLSRPIPVPNECTDHRWKWFKVSFKAV
ncbi:uncharacterized protein LOC121781728 [Salvia splendens]|uniref:uncharacterized protein LOC121781728 n=1 Tax=Salvia splendens TaxID=180675 RepID=UPI001C25E8FB|nr:uncharacterized protein LOC121781728 [Salvia splendens]